MIYRIKTGKIEILDNLPSNLTCLDFFIGYNGLVDENFIYNVSYDLLILLEYFRKNKIINGNISIYNIFVSKDNSLYLNDKVFNDYTFKAPETIKNERKKKLHYKNDIYSLGLSLVVILTRKNISSLDKLNDKILFRRETGINIYYKNLLDNMIEPIFKYRITSKKALRYLKKIKKGKLKDPYDIQKIYQDKI